MNSLCWRASAGTAASARARLSGTSSRSRAKPATANLRASSTSRWVRRRRFSISASVRSSRSLSSWNSSALGAACSAASGAASAGPCRSLATGGVRSSAASSCFRLWVIASSRCRVCPGPTDDARGVVDHGDDAGVVHPGRADHADGADDAGAAPALGARAVGCHDHRAAGRPEQLVLAADEDLQALADWVSSTRRRMLCRVSSISNRPRIRSRSARLVTSSKSFACPRTIRNPPSRLSSLPLQVASPAETTFWVSVSSWLRCCSISARMLARASAKLPCEARGEVVAGLDQGRRRHAERHVDHAVLDQPVVADDDHQGAARRERHELDVLERALVGGRGHDAGVAREGRARWRRRTGPPRCSGR